MTRHKWTPKQLSELQARYPHERTADIAADLRIRIELVYSKASRMGLRKSTAFLAADKSGRIFKGGTLGQKTQFKPGHQTWNAGRIGWQAGGRSAETRFKAGQKPHTTLPVGSYRVVKNKAGAPHLERKMTDTPGANNKRWVPVSRLVWEAANGPVPDGHIVVFKPGTATCVLEEITLDRLECISRAENARRNHPATKSPEIAKLIQLKGAITRQVNRIAKENKS